jgi:hypothetical protein
LHLGDLFEGTEEERQKAEALAMREAMETRLRSSRGDISARAGQIERESPLFFGTGANPLLFGLLLICMVVPAFGQEMLENGHREMFLSAAIASRPALMGVVEAADVAGVWWMAKKLGAHHRKLAHVLTLVDIGQDLPWAVRNLTLSKPARAQGLQMVKK